MRETPTAARDAADSALPCLCEAMLEGQHTTPCPKVYAYAVAVAMTAYAAERIEEVTEPLIARGDKAIAERDAALARLGAAEAQGDYLEAKAEFDGGANCSACLKDRPEGPHLRYDGRPCSFHGGACEGTE